MVAAVYVPYFYIEDYALAISIDKEMTFYVLSIMNAATFCARFLPNWLADR